MPRAGLAPIVIELYQSQGCSSCPPANAALNAIASDPAVLALSFAVTYWDQLGWKDGFARPEYTQRQYDYAHAASGNRVFTPQFVINGVNAGSQASSLRQAAAKAGSPRNGPIIAISGSAVEIGAAKAQRPATVWQVTYDPRVRNVAIRAGENGGRTLPHRNIVTRLKALGTWSGPARHFALAVPKDPALRSAIFVQRGKGGPIIAARKI
ncbi:DUF1223 domain-containing protein [Sphingomonas sp.]|uniref:DUF1223 domain-containing protein n=1 Tax=Sphingomonas sp. TaxID=28214 RepID=UPI00286B42DB|nr:DUF1223 domain-containing protein [Sphingomonas sp.]